MEITLFFAMNLKYVRLLWDAGLNMVFQAIRCSSRKSLFFYPFFFSMSLLNFAQLTRFNYESEIMMVVFFLHDLNPHLAFVSGVVRRTLICYNLLHQIHKALQTGFLVISAWVFKVVSFLYFLRHFTFEVALWWSMD